MAGCEGKLSFPPQCTQPLSVRSASAEVALYHAKPQSSQLAAGVCLGSVDTPPVSARGATFATPKRGSARSNRYACGYALSMRDDDERPDEDVQSLEERSAALEEKIEKVSDDWEQKTNDPSVPGAREPLEDVEVERQDLGEEPLGPER